MKKSEVRRLRCSWHGKDWYCWHYPEPQWLAYRWVMESPERQTPRREGKVFTRWTAAISWATDVATHNR